jgi:hypothetical protein
MTWFFTSHILTCHFVGIIGWLQEFRIANWTPSSQIVDNQNGKLRFGIYINESANDFVENLYDLGILFWYCRIQGTNENVSVFWPSVDSIIICSAEHHRAQVNE